jgi:RNA polymerase sigma-70 factor (ECF subfamily)
MTPPGAPDVDLPSAIPNTAASRDDGTGETAAQPRADEAMLIEQLRARDEGAFVVLIERYGASLRRLARIYSTAAVADEVVQETWIGVILGLDRFEGRSSFRSWLFGILKNIARSRGERERRQIPFSAFVDPTEERGPAVDPGRFRSADDAWVGHWLSYPERWDELPEQRYLSNEGVDVARRAIEALPPAQREVVNLRDVEGWSSEDVSEALGISPGNQRVLLHRGRSKVRAALEDAMAAMVTPAESHQ